MLLLMAATFMIAGVWQLALVRIERARTRIEIDYVRRSKISQKELKRIADDAWEKLQADASQHDRERAQRNEKFWTEFAAAYGRATGQVFPKPPPELFATKKLPPRGSA